MKKQDEVSSAKTKFHRYHGSNIILYDDNTVAYRKAGYADAVAFSEKPLKPGEVFTLEIESTERGWSGDMKIGLTQLNPYEAEAMNLQLPQSAAPDLKSVESSWIFSISKRHRPSLNESSSINEERFAQTYESSLEPSVSDLETDRLPTDVGSQVGIKYIRVPRNSENGRKELLELHVIVNGEDQGPVANIPYPKEPLYVVIDVYGCTKQVRIVQKPYGVESLQSTCREAILTRIKEQSVAKLPLPKPLKEYLLDNERSPNS